MGETIGGGGTGGTEAGDITYSLTYGSAQRLGFAVKMPPSTLARDVSGSQAINKAKLKLEIAYDVEYTTYVDGSL